MRFLKIPALLAVFLLALAGCGKSYSYKYRLTVTVQDGAKQITASNVVRVTEIPTRRGGARPPALCGSALIIPLEHGVILATLEGPRGVGPDNSIAKWTGSPTRILLTGYKLPDRWSYHDDSGIRSLPDRRGRIALQPQQMPGLFTFNNSQMPETIRTLDPEDFSKDLGPYVQLLSAFVEPTSDSITRSDLKKYLPWFNINREYLDGDPMGKGVNGYHSRRFERCD